MNGAQVDEWNKTLVNACELGTAYQVDELALEYSVGSAHLHIALIVFFLCCGDLDFAYRQSELQEQEKNDSIFSKLQTQIKNKKLTVDIKDSRLAQSPM